MAHLYVVDSRLAGTYQDIPDDKMSYRFTTFDGKQLTLTRVTVTDDQGVRTEVLASPTSCYKRVKEAFLADRQARQQVPGNATMDNDEHIVIEMEDPQLVAVTKEVADEHDPDVDDSGDLARRSDGWSAGADPQDG